MAIFSHYKLDILPSITVRMSTKKRVNVMGSVSFNTFLSWPIFVKMIVIQKGWEETLTSETPGDI